MCNCHDHSDEFCDPETGQCKVSGSTPYEQFSCVCMILLLFFLLMLLKLISIEVFFLIICYQNCLHNTTGFHCEKCLEGFYGNATIGGPTNCKKCPCPMTSPPNRSVNTVQWNHWIGSKLRAG